MGLLHRRGRVGRRPRCAAALGPDAGFFAVFRPHGRPWRPGERVRLPALAATLATLADDGFDAFYEGDLARPAGPPVRGPRRGCSTLGDLRGHTSTWGEPIAIDYRGVRVTSHPPNSSGVVALELLSILARFEPPPPEAFGPDGVTDPAWIHLGIEAAKLAMADRDAHLTDPDFRDIPVERLLDPGYAARAGGADRPAARRAPADGDRTRAAAGRSTSPPSTRDGNAVSLIESNYAGFGSGVVDPATGIHYQNRGPLLQPRAGPPERPGARQADAPHAAPRDAVP